MAENRRPDLYQITGYHERDDGVVALMISYREPEDVQDCLSAMRNVSQPDGISIVPLWWQE